MVFGHHEVQTDGQANLFVESMGILLQSLKYPRASSRTRLLNLLDNPRWFERDRR